MSGSTPFSVSHLPQQDDIKIMLAEETKDRFVGPMPVQTFMDDYLPRLPGQEACPRVDEQPFRKIPEGASEKSFYTLLVDAMKPFTPGFEVIDTSQHPSSGVEYGGFKLRPDVALYPEDCGRTKITDFELMGMFLEVKSSDKFEAFKDPPQDELSKLSGEERDAFLNQWQFECDTALGTLTRGQMIAYALTQLGSQFRHFAFSVAIIGKHARMIRWDRGGAVVTERFDYTEQPGLLADFFWRFSLASTEGRGLDTSVTEVEADFDGREICTKLKLPPSTKLFYYGVPDDDISRAQRDNLDPTALYCYIGPRPHFPSRSLIGRATRSLPVYDPVKGRVVYLKDTWRIDSHDMQKEGDTYRQLHGYQVPHIAPFERGNDIDGHGSHTVTHDYVEESWVCGMPFATGHIHYRMVLGVVGRELSTFRSTHELASAVADALEAHEDAYNKAGILHRDVSVGNLIVTDDGEGLLIDWDLCRKRGIIQKRRHDRTGTWQFMSAALLLDPTKHQDFEDDLESFLHVLTWTSIRYCPSNLTAQERTVYLSSTFDEVHEKNNVFVGGEVKSGRLVKNTYLPSELITFSAGSPLLDLLREISLPFAVRYQSPPSEQDVRNFEEARSAGDLSTPLWVNILANLSVVGQYNQKLEKLKSSFWFPSTIRAYLQNPDLTWPTNDKAERLSLAAKSGATKKQEAKNSNHINSQDEARAHSRFPGESNHSAGRKSIAKDKRLAKRRKVA
ncbi:hypothetical protein EV702DRAFT_1156666 [Suillus placidus]|uniref:Fungal-type protein kinase domain-containing protein n=1 Tax=Suillus placidus TaxID=48579 RepID=A0A9P7CVE7_9AGAM|nr:hypothetical protein EV702DRAFT_1156666 [Suillus placidus]